MSTLLLQIRTSRIQVWFAIRRYFRCPRRHALRTQSCRAAWVATVKNDDYIKLEGLKSMVNNGRHRQEMVAGEMWRYLLSGMDFFALLLHLDNRPL